MRSALYVILLFSGQLFAQSVPGSNPFELNVYPKNYFRLPLDLPVSLSGNFGEPRSNHFHTGIDFRTNQRTGYPVFASAGGYVSRIAESPYGYGKAVYIDHPNGFTTVYAHLDKFSPVIRSAIRSYQYEHEVFNAYIELSRDKILVKKGDIIGYSGNSGSSGGPHLHFEIRDTRTEEPLNPLLFGLRVPDSRPPEIEGIHIYPLDEHSSVNGRNFPAGYSLTPAGSSGYRIQEPGPILLNGNIGFGVTGIDRQDGSSFRNGVFLTELRVDGQTVYQARMARLNFSRNRALNSHIDYGAYLLDRRRIIKCFTDPGNPLKIYTRLADRGIVRFKDDRTHRIEIRLIDFEGNTSTADFTVQSTSAAKHFERPKGYVVDTFYYDRPNEYSTDDFRLELPAGALYSTIDFTYSTEEVKPGAFSRTHRIHDKRTPLHVYGTVSMKVSPSLTRLDKAVIVNQDKDALETSEDENGWLRARIREFGEFHVLIDENAPVIQPVTIWDGKDMSENSFLILKIRDDLSGIKSYRATIDGRWVLMEYDAKSASLQHEFEDMSTGKHTFKLVVADNKNNAATYEAVFYK